MIRFAHKSFLKEKRKKESSLLLGVGWLSSFFEKIRPLLKRTFRIVFIMGWRFF